MSQRAAVYLRVSTAEQREKETIKTQQAFAARYCDLHKIQVVRTYVDDGVTGTLPLCKRPAGERLLADARQSLFNTLYFYRLDRLGRDPRLTLEAVNELESCGVKVKSMTEPFDTGDATGRFLLTILSGVAGLERETFLERSRAGTERLAREGAWLGGVVPFGYRVEGKKRDARLVVSDEPLAGVGMSEADVVRMVFRLAATEGWSATAIAKHLNQLNVPPAYTRDGRKVTRGKRKCATAGVWRRGRVLHILKNTTYRGVHWFGRRSIKKRELIERKVPAIVTEEIWNQTQKILEHNRITATRNVRRSYLLRCMMRCNQCGLTFVGSCRQGKHIYYRCGGKAQLRGPYGRRGERCPSVLVPGEIEDQVWADIEHFLRNPGQVIETLAEQANDLGEQRSAILAEVEMIEGQLAEKDEERTRILTLYRKGRIEEALLDQQMAAIENERKGLSEALEGARQRLQGLTQATTDLDATETLLAELNGRLDGPLTFELKREIVETLVEGIRVETTETNGRKEAVVHITYRFDAPRDAIVTRTDTRAVHNRTARIRRSYWCQRRPPGPVPRRLGARPVGNPFLPWEVCPNLDDSAHQTRGRAPRISRVRARGSVEQTRRSLEAVGV
ncbi:MAG: recombinase family protein [Candidatus Eisenbacteria sp.]|nr:recombinase family protein [Candidatus Eisenbacteria bacterium]